jgi:hypothetical protein
MKLTLSILSWIFLPVIILSAGIVLEAGQDHPAPVSQVSPALHTITRSNDLNHNSAILPVTGGPLEQHTAAIPTLDNFVAVVKNGQAGQVVGVYVPKVLALSVAQQPASKPAYVNTIPGYATQFGLAAQYGTTGLLAHNYLSGALFFNLSTGQEVDVIYGDGSIRRYSILIIRHFRALSPTNPASNFVDLDNNSGVQLSSSDLFYQIYAKGDRVVFQTCITANGNTSWGRLFVIATPISVR